MPRPRRTAGAARPALAVAATTSALALALGASGGPPALGSSAEPAPMAATVAAVATVATPRAVKATAATGAAAAALPPVLLPDMRSVQPSELRIEMIDGVRWVRFTSQLANAGDGPIEVRPNDAGDCPKGKQHATQVL